MTDSPETVSDSIANEPADAAVSPPKIPAVCCTTPVDEPKVAAEVLPSEQEPVATPELLKT